MGTNLTDVVTAIQAKVGSDNPVYYKGVLRTDTTKELNSFGVGLFILDANGDKFDFHLDQIGRLSMLEYYDKVGRYVYVHIATV